ncbi:hypothetical protein BDF20DRAFT_914611 [Mycotypha africana]|uniref:uncharacterized protein n=1 Tax=Mycotypha africana TaxID=64632 RepID=UPI00230016B8|nr:uncharacterized protein BDF20DRAFT_914611 [Mycotypha africana]KAI8975750.1 hypothetical protein BDF20DRAFT_914611 [Mycotypha africana]
MNGSQPAMIVPFLTPPPYMRNGLICRPSDATVINLITSFPTVPSVKRISCPRKNTPALGAPNKRALKHLFLSLHLTPENSETATSLSSIPNINKSTCADTPDDDLAAPVVIQPVESPNTNCEPTSHAFTAVATDLSSTHIPHLTTGPQCRHCRGYGHKMRTHHLCPLNPKNSTVTSVSSFELTSYTDDVDMSDQPASATTGPGAPADTSTRRL